ncbi:winged helix-turn-helix transcriptional regulator [Streptomyces sp. NPDC090499]|uniref:winged helix-turn-helix transcriptional regulator n=1 Tax=unclassified Streptomyces TaxID=2593676 RepID=UPI0037FF4D98
MGTLSEGPKRYSDLADAVPAVSQRMLTLTLKQLCRNGLVVRVSHPEVPPRVEYGLTALGRSLLSSVLALAGWSADHREEVRRHRVLFDAARRTDGRP